MFNLNEIKGFILTKPDYAPLFQNGRFIDLSRLIFTLFLGAVLCSIPSLQRKVGRDMMIMFLSILIGHPSRTIGAQLVFTVLGSIATCLSAAYCILAWEFAALVNRQNNGEPNYSGPMILFCFFIFSQYWMGWIKVYKPILTHFSLSFQTITVFQLPNTIYRTDPMRMMIFQFAYDFMLGMALCQLTNLVFFPKTAASVFNRDLSSALKQSGDFLKDTCNTFFSHEFELDVDASYKRVLALRKDINMLHTHRRDLTNEIIRGWFQPSKWKAAVSICNLIEQQLETMHSCLSEKNSLLKAHKRVLDILASQNILNKINPTSPSSATSEKNGYESIKRVENWASELFSNPNSESNLASDKIPDVTITKDPSSPNTSLPSSPKLERKGTSLSKPSDAKENSLLDLFKSTSDDESNDEIMNVNEKTLIEEEERKPRERPIELKLRTSNPSPNSILRNSITEDKFKDNFNSVEFHPDVKEEKESDICAPKKSVQFLHSRKASIEAFGIIDISDDFDDSDDKVQLSIQTQNNLTRSSIIDDFDCIPEIELRGDYNNFIEIVSIIGDPLTNICEACKQAMYEVADFVLQSLGKAPLGTERLTELRNYYDTFDSLLSKAQNKVNFNDEVMGGIERAARNEESPYDKGKNVKSPLSPTSSEGGKSGEELFLIFYYAFSVKVLLQNTIHLLEHIQFLGDIGYRRKSKTFYFPVARRVFDMTSTSEDGSFWNHLYKEKKAENRNYTLYPGVTNKTLELFNKHIADEKKAMMSETDYSLYPNDDTVMLQHREQYINQLLNANTTRSFGGTAELSSDLAQVAASLDIKAMYEEDAFDLPKEEQDNAFRHFLRNALYSISGFLSTYASKHGVQLVLCNGSLSLFAFMMSTQNWFFEWKGNWMLITVTYVLSPTVGDSSLVGFYRSLGTVLGCLWAYIAWICVPYNPYFGIFMMVIFTYPFGYLQLFGPHNKMGLIACLSFGIVYFNAMNYWHKPIAQTAYRRTVLVIIGSFWSMFISLFVFPLNASASARRSVASVLESLSILFSQSIFHMMKPPRMKDAHLWEKQVALQHSTLHKISLNIDNMLLLIPGEVQLEKRFPMKTFKLLVKSMNHLITATVELALTCTKVGNDCYKTIIIDPNHVHLRKEYVAVMLLHFHMVVMAIRYKTPIPQKLPSAKAARRRFLTAVYGTLMEKKENQGQVKFLYWNAYMMALEEVIENLYSVTHIVRGLFGETRHIDLKWDTLVE